MQLTPSEIPQTPSGDEIYLDHVGWFVRDMQGVASAMERLGFVLTPFVAQHNADPVGGTPVPAGTGNRCAMLRRGYLEFLSVIPGVNTTLSRQLNVALDRYQGLHLLAFTINNSESAYQRLNSENFLPLDPVNLRRPLTLNDGSEAEVAFTVIRVPPEKMPEGRIQMLRQETPELVWQDHLIASNNGIVALGGVILCVDGVEEVSDRFSRFTGRDCTGGINYRLLDLDRGRIGFANRSNVQDLLPNVAVPTTPFMAAVTLESEDLDQTRSFLDGAGISVISLSDNAILIGADDACGVSIIIFNHNDTWPRKV